MHAIKLPAVEFMGTDEVLMGDDAFLSFNINMGEFYQNEAERLASVIDDDKRRLYDSDLWIAKRVRRRSKFNLSAMSPKELVRAQNAERAARVAQLRELVEAPEFAEAEANETDLCSLLEAPAFI